MKIVRVHNPSGLTATKRRSKKTMATRRRKRRRSASVGRPRSVARKAVNPRRRRRSRRRNPTVIVARRRHSRRAAPVARRRRHSRRRNPSAFKIGQIFKDMVYGAGGAIATRTIASIGAGFIPGGLMNNAIAPAVLQAGIAVTLVRWGGKKFLGPAQGDIMMAGGLISAGLALADQFLPNLQGQLTGGVGNILRAPVSTAPGLDAGSLKDVYEVEGFNGFNDVYDVPAGNFNEFPAG